MAFYGHKTLIIISYHFYGFLWLCTNPSTTLRHFCPKHLLQENDIQLENQDILLKLVNIVSLFFLNSINNKSENPDILRNIIDEINNITLVQFKCY